MNNKALDMVIIAKCYKNLTNNANLLYLIMELVVGESSGLQRSRCSNP